MFRKVMIISFSLTIGLPASSPKAAVSDNPSMDANVVRIAEQWAGIKYLVKDKHEQLKQIDKLAADAAGLVQRYPARAEPLLWDGIVTSEEAAMAPMLDKLHYAKVARILFERAEVIDPNAANGGVELSLGVLYYRVPGFPIGFGNDSKARSYLEKARAIDPDGLDSAYFYGDFLISQHEYRKAREVLVHGLAAPPTVDRPIWDKGRRGEIQALIAKIDNEDGRH